MRISRIRFTTAGSGLKSGGGLRLQPETPLSNPSSQRAESAPYLISPTPGMHFSVRIGSQGFQRIKRPTFRKLQTLLSAPIGSS